MPYITEYTQTDIEDFYNSDFVKPLVESFTNQKNLLKTVENVWVEKGEKFDSQFECFCFSK